MLSAAAASSILSLSGTSALAADASGQAHGSPGLLSGNSVSAPVDVPVNVCGNSANAAAGLNPAGGNSCASSGSSAAPQRSAARAQQQPTAPARSAARSAAPERPAPRAAAHQSASVAPERPAAPRQRPAAPQERTAVPHQGPQSYGQRSHEGPRSPEGTTARSEASHSPGVLSGNSVAAPVEPGVNFCGNTVDVVAALNPAFGNRCAEGAPEPGTPEVPLPPKEHSEPPAPRPESPESPEGPKRPAPKAPTPVSEAPHERPTRVEVTEAGAPQLARTGAEPGLAAAGVASAGLVAAGAVLYRRGRATRP
ncbi:chaplin family protein [Streptomyces sp. PmtG]